MSEEKKAPFARRGLQVVPVTRLGWLLLGGYLALVLAGTALMIALARPNDDLIALGWAAIVLITSAAFTIVAWKLSKPVAPPRHRDADYWFVPKLFGFGATPVTWQGWAVTIGAAVLVILDMRFVEPPLVKIVIAAALIVALIAISAHKTAGGWRWRWGPGE